MSKWFTTFLLLFGIGLLIGSLWLRTYSDGQYEIKTIDLVLIVVPLLLAGLVTGKLRGFDLFGVKADLSDLWAEAANSRIEHQVASVPVSPVDDAIELVRPSTKRSVDHIPRLIEQKTQALAFQLGRGGYYDAMAIKSYFDALYGSSYLRFVVLNLSDGSLFGMYDAKDLIAYLRTQGDTGYAEFENMLNRGDETAREWLARLPGFASSKQAVQAKTSKRDALQAMEDAKLDSLPVTDALNRFIGTVERAKLTTSLILAVTENLSAGSRA